MLLTGVVSAAVCTARCAAARPKPRAACHLAAQRPSLKPRQLCLTKSAADEALGLADADPEDARGAIAVGLKFSNAGMYEKAQVYFEKALELPGTGLKRWRDKPPALSTGELTSALYNIACCRSQLGDVENALVAIAGAIEQGYKGPYEFQQMRQDPDLATLREDPRFEGLIGRFERKAPEKSGFLGLF